MYDPPTENNWRLPTTFHEKFRLAYNDGYEKAKDKKMKSKNPYGVGTSERLWWFEGWNDFLHDWDKK